MNIRKVDRLNRHARALGCPDLLFLDSEPTAAHLDYLDLLPNRASGSEVAPDAIAEFQGRPLLYLVDGWESAPHEIIHLQRLLANRGDHACLGIVRPGSLDVYPINFDPKTLRDAGFETIRISRPDAPTFFQSLATGSFELEGRPDNADYVFKRIHGLLSAASEDLAGKDGCEGSMRGLDVLSTTGRALFFRFLIDREIVARQELTDICPDAADLRDAFSNPEKAAATSCWLDETFNGDLLPLGEQLQPRFGFANRLRMYQEYYKGVGDSTDQRLFLHLQAILRGWRHVGEYFQTSFDIDWDDFNFAHIPIGVLSQVYESFSHQWDAQEASAASVYYTPRHVAKLMVDEAFAGIEEPSEAIVLDPACGGGVFLVLSFRQLVREYWKKDGVWPSTRTIQQILYNQLRGFEVSESALRLSALALYISAIEVNRAPRPPRSLKFPRSLRNEVLFNFGPSSADGTEAQSLSLGSLGPEVPHDFNGIFDIVVTNPPWTRLRASPGDEPLEAKQKQKALLTSANASFSELSRRALRSRGFDKLAQRYANPDNNPDLPLLWRATEWARPGGVIAMALPARIILKQGNRGKAAREAILRALAITGILNGSDLEKTPVWPNMDLPFILLFARNLVPSQYHHFHFVTPLRESRLSRIGLFRLDYKSAQSVSAQEVIAKPWLLKALAVGTLLDVDIIDKLPKASIGSFWCKANSLYSGAGYNLSKNIKQESADHLMELPDFDLRSAGFSIPFGSLPTWFERHKRKTANQPRDRKLYEAPVLIVPQAIRASRESPKAFPSFNRPIAFSQSFYGFSAAEKPDGEMLVALLYLIVHSKLFLYFCLLRSSRLGASYRTILKEDIEAFPFPDLANITPEDARRIRELAHMLETASKKPWQEINTFIFDLYSLDDIDATVIDDTITFSSPYRSVRNHAETPVTPADIDHFCLYLEDMLQPLFRIVGQTVAVRSVHSHHASGHPAWRFVSVTLETEPLEGLEDLLPQLMTEANRTAASRVVLRVPRGALLVGMLNQKRFWTRSRAWLCSLHIEEHHLDVFPLGSK